MSVRTCYIDVDLTLIDIYGDLLPGVEDMLCQLHDRYKLICWSAGGQEYAEKVLIKHKITRFFDYVLDKPDIIIDDSPEGIVKNSNIVLIEHRNDWKNVWDKIFKKNTILDDKA